MVVVNMRVYVRVWANKSGLGDLMVSNFSLPQNTVAESFCGWIIAPPGVKEFYMETKHQMQFNVISNQDDTKQFRVINYSVTGWKRCTVSQHCTH